VLFWEEGYVKLLVGFQGEPVLKNHVVYWIFYFVVSATTHLIAWQSQSPALKAPELSPQQRLDATKIINDAKEHVRILAERLSANGKRFDEVLLGETKDVEADGQAANEIKAVLNETAETRLQAARNVVHLLTPEQRRFLKLKMAKPDSERGILEVFAKVFHLETK
jgi:hypothetical protein